MKKLILGIALMIPFSNIFPLKQIITNTPHGQFGHAAIAFCMAMILAKKYGIQFCYRPFEYSEHIFEITEPKMPQNSSLKLITVKDELDIILHKDKDNILFDVTIYPLVHEVDPEWVEELIKCLKLRNVSTLKTKVNKLPADRVSIAVHIRKGSGGGRKLDGNQSSVQLYNFDRSRVIYTKSGISYPFDFTGSHIRTTKRGGGVDRLPHGELKFPPDQYYVDQIVKISEELGDIPLFVQLFTDDKKPKALLDRIKKAVNKPNIQFHFEDNWNCSYKDRIAQDLYNISRFDALIRSQSYFAKVAELIGHHKVVICPIHALWVSEKIIVDNIFIKGSTTSLI